MSAPDPAAENPLAAPGRYARQVRFRGWGEEAQARLEAAAVLVVGAGALGSASAELLTRAGVGRLRLVDRDFVELTNLHRQTLYDEADVAAGLPKAEAAAAKLRRINGNVAVEPVVADVDFRNLPELLAGIDLMIDGTDNFETRFLLNDASLARNIPWIYGGCVGAEGRVMAILPHETPCLRCLMRDVPPPGSLPTCDAAGVLGPIVSFVASRQIMEALKLLGGRRAAVERALWTVDLWENRTHSIDLAGLRERRDCPACGLEPRYEWLSGSRGRAPVVLCGRNAVQITPDMPLRLDWAVLAPRLEPLGRVERNPFLLKLHTSTCRLTLFRDGRAIVEGTEDPAVARGLYDRFLGG